MLIAVTYNVFVCMILHFVILSTCTCRDSTMIIQFIFTCMCVQTNVYNKAARTIRSVAEVLLRKLLLLLIQLLQLSVLQHKTPDMLSACLSSAHVAEVTAL